MDDMNLPTNITPPEIIINGNPASPANIDNYDGFMQFMMLSAMNANLVKLRKIAESQVAKETESPIVSVTGLLRFQLPQPWISFSLRNDGPADLWMVVNKENFGPNDSPIHTKEVVNFGPGVANFMTLKTAPGTTANIRLFGAK